MEIFPYICNRLKAVHVTKRQARRDVLYKPTKFKGNEEEDLNKAEWYLDYLEKMEKENKE